MQPPHLLSLPHTVIEPPAVSLLPTAPGFLLLILLLLACIFFIWHRYHTLAWRRQALKELQSIYQEYLRQPDSLSYCKQVNALLKRVALQRFAQSAVTPLVVAPLFGDRWLGFLDKTCKGSAFAKQFPAFAVLPYQSIVNASDLSLQNLSVSQLNKHIKRWIIKHNPTRTLSSHSIKSQDPYSQDPCSDVVNSPVFKQKSPNTQGFSVKAIPS